MTLELHVFRVPHVHLQYYANNTSVEPLPHHSIKVNWVLTDLKNDIPLCEYIKKNPLSCVLALCNTQAGTWPSSGGVAVLHACCFQNQAIYNF